MNDKSLFYTFFLICQGKNWKFNGKPGGEKKTDTGKILYPLKDYSIKYTSEAKVPFARASSWLS